MWAAYGVSVHCVADLGWAVGDGVVGNTRGVGEMAVRRVDFGYFVRPGEETWGGVPRVEPTLGYLIEHPQGKVLVDTGMGRHPEVDQRYRPRRVGLGEALAGVGVGLAEVRFVVNCHLHFDHCGGNPELAGRPVFAQRAELSAARG